jgi:hypothetical protein
MWRIFDVFRLPATQIEHPCHCAGAHDDALAPVVAIPVTVQAEAYHHRPQRISMRKRCPQDRRERKQKRLRSRAESA